MKHQEVCVKMKHTHILLDQHSYPKKFINALAYTVTHWMNTYSVYSCPTGHKWTLKELINSGDFYCVPESDAKIRAA